MDAKARQDCIKEIDLLKVKNQRRGRRRHALRSVLLRCLSWDLPPQENNWSAPDCLDLCVGVWAHAHVCTLPWMDMNAEECLCTQVWIWMSVCVRGRERLHSTCVLLRPYVFVGVCVCMGAPVLYTSRLTLTLFFSFFFLNAKNIVFYLFVMFRAGQQ